MNAPATTIALDDTDRTIINALQRGFPLTPKPYADAAQAIGINETELLARLQSLLARGVLTRFGPLWQIERAGGRFVLCACHAEQARLDDIIAALNARPEIAHNYERSHHLNLWFVVALEHADDLATTLARIEHDADVQVLAFPKDREFFVNLYLPA